jgi:hypothetical protein
MANGVFNIAKGRVYELYRDVKNAAAPYANSAFIVVLLKAAAADAALIDNADLGAVLTATNVEANFTNYTRKTLAAASLAAIPAPDNTNDWVQLAIPNQVWTAAGGATNNSIVKLLVCFDNDTTAGTDANIIPMTHHDFVVTTDGTDITGVVAAAGFYKAA